MPTATPLDFASAGLSALSTGYKIYDSVRKNKQAKEIERNTKRSIYNRPEEIDNAYNFAASEVDNTGLQDYITTQANQGLSTSLDAILKSGGKADFATVNNSYGNTLRAAIGAISKDRAQKIATLNNTAYNLARAKDAEFQYNKDAPYKDKMQKAAMLRGQAAQSANEAFGVAAAGLSNYATATTRPGEYGVSDVEGAPSASMERLPYNPSTIPPPQRQNSMSIQPIQAPPYQSELLDTQPANWQISSFDEWGNPVYR